MKRIISIHKNLMKGCFAITKRSIFLLFITMALMTKVSAATVNVSNAEQLLSAVNNGAAGDTINVAAGTYSMTGTLSPKANMTIKGAGITSTILQPEANWNPGTLGLPIGPTDVSDNSAAYFFNIGSNAHVTISDMCMDGKKQLQGAVLGNGSNYLTVYNVYFHDYTFTGVRVHDASNLVVHDCEFINMAIVGMDPESAAICFSYISNSQFYNNQFYFATHGVYYGDGVNAGNYFGIKGRQLRQSRIHHNTIMINFSIELPFEKDYDVEIDHNYLAGMISVPRDGDGGGVPASGVSFHIHHNYISAGWVLEWERNCVELDHNLIDNSRQAEGNIIGGWYDNSVYPGPTKIHDNLMTNIGLGILDIGRFNNTQIYNNWVKTTDFKAAGKTLLIIPTGPTDIDRSSWVIKDNIFDCSAQARALFWQDLGAGFTIQNNTMINVTDTANYSNPNTGATRGPLAPLHFTCGSHGAYTVNQWGLDTSINITIPAKPADLSAKSVWDTRIDLAWSDTSFNSTGVEIERKTGTDGSYEFIGKGSSNNGIYQDFGLTANTPYYYRIRAYNDQGVSSYSDEATATTFNVNYIPVPPSMLTAISPTFNQINLAWVDNSNNETGFKIERKTGSGGTYAQIGSVEANVTSYSDAGLADSTQYFYRVRATNNTGESDYSNEANATTPPAKNVLTTRYEAESYNSEFNTVKEDFGEGTMDVYSNGSGGWIAFNSIDLTGVIACNVRVATPQNNNPKLEIRIDSLTGTLLGSTTTTNTGGWAVFRTDTISLTGASGTHTLYVVFVVNGESQNLNWFELVRLSGSTTSVPSILTSASVYCLYPNPSDGKHIIIKQSQQAGEVCVSINDINGRIVYETKVYDAVNALKISLNKGVYFVRLKSGNIANTQKLIVE